MVTTTVRSKPNKNQQKKKQEGSGKPEEKIA